MIARFRGSVFTALLLAGSIRAAGQEPAAAAGSAAAVLSEIDGVIREKFWDADLKGVDWAAGVRKAEHDLARAKDAAERDAIYDRLLAELADSHTFRIAAGALPQRNWSTSGLRIGREGEGYAVKGILPGSSAERAGLRLGDRILAVRGRKYGKERVNFRDLFLALEGAPGAWLDVAWAPVRGGEPTTSRLALTPEEPGETLVWRSARVIRRDGRPYGYARLWGMNAETALAIVDMLLDRGEAMRVKAELSGWAEIEGFLLDVRANSGGYDPNILTTFLRGRWSAGNYYLRSREGRRWVPPVYKPLPVALLVNAATASSAEGLVLQFRQHGIGPIVGEPTAGMATGGAFEHRLSDGSTLWVSAGSIEDAQGRSYEGRGVPPDVFVEDRPAAEAGKEEAIVEAALRALARREPADPRYSRPQ